ncbi:MAG: hypothetical protein AAGA26_00165 [Pseudomonadota bacterium]
MKLRQLPPDLLNAARIWASKAALIERDLERAKGRRRTRPSRIAALEADLAHTQRMARAIISRGASEVRAASVGASARPARNWADIPGRNGIQSRPGGALASPIWLLNIAAELKETGAEYAAVIHEIDATGVKVVDPERIRVDGSPVGEGPAARALWLIQRRDIARAAIENIRPMSPIRRTAADRRVPIAAETILRMACVEDRTIFDVLAAHGWRRSGSSKRKAVGLLADALSAIYGRWGNRKAA